MKTATLRVGFYSETDNECRMEALTGLRSRVEPKCVVEYSIEGETLTLHHIKSYYDKHMDGANPYENLNAHMPLTGTVSDCGSGELRVLAIEVDNLAVRGMCPSRQYYEKMQASRQMRSPETLNIVEAIINPKGRRKPA